MNRRVLGLFAAVWLNLALAPCAMALESVDDHDCPHCPPAQMHEQGGMHGSMNHEMPCADGLSDCAIAEDLNHDGRGGQIKLKDAAQLPVAITNDLVELPSAVAGYVHVASDPPLPDVSSPPLHKLHCVYLK